MDAATIGVILAGFLGATVGFLGGFIFGASVVVNRIRLYRDNDALDSCKPCVGDLLTYLGQ